MFSILVCFQIFKSKSTIFQSCPDRATTSCVLTSTKGSVKCLAQVSCYNMTDVRGMIQNNVDFCCIFYTAQSNAYKIT